MAGGGGDDGELDGEGHARRRRRWGHRGRGAMTVSWTAMATRVGGGAAGDTEAGGQARPLCVLAQ